MSYKFKTEEQNLVDYFIQIHFPDDPKILIKNGMVVPFKYLCTWYKTMGCNNWRKRNKLPMLRGQINNPGYYQVLTDRLWEENKE